MVTFLPIWPLLSVIRSNSLLPFSCGPVCVHGKLEVLNYFIRPLLGLPSCITSHMGKSHFGDC